METTKATTRLAMLVILILSASCDSNPSNYDDCVLKHVKSGMNELATRETIRACQRKFPKSSQPELELLPPGAVSALTGKLEINNQRARGNIYNGNGDWVVSEITILISPKEPSLPPGFRFETPKESLEKEMDEFGGIIISPEQPSPEKYRVNIWVHPFSTKDISFNVNWGSTTSHTWKIVEAKGERRR